jgi:ABC-2 type transport system permease protein
MTALAHPTSLDSRVRLDQRPLLGFGTFLRKELTEWVRGRRALVIGAVATAFSALAALSAWLQANFGDLELSVGGRAPDAARVYSTDPTVTTMAMFSTPIITVMAIFAGMSLLATERESGTLAWALTKPVSRSSIFLAKWTAALLAFGLAAIAIPVVVAAAASTIAYGTAPDLMLVAKVTGLWLAVPALFIGFTLFAGVLISSHAGVAGVGLLFMLTPALFGSLIPAPVLEALPVGIGNWVIGFAAGESVPLSTPIGWLVAMVVFLAGGIGLFRRQEL